MYCIVELSIIFVLVWQSGSATHTYHNKQFYLVQCNWPPAKKMSEKKVGRPGKVFRCAFVISTMILRWQRIGLSLCRQSFLGACPWRPQQEVKSIWRPSYSHETSQWIKIISVGAFNYFYAYLFYHSRSESFRKVLWKVTIAWMPLQKSFNPILC